MLMRHSDRPFATVVTVCRNSAATIESTIRSVAANRSPDLTCEYLVIDGASSDETLKIVRSAAEAGVVDRWISEPDEGLYHAMNKGLSMATGKFIAFLNSDDYLLENAVAASLSLLASSGADYLYADALMKNLLTGGINSTLRADEESIYFRQPYVHQTLWCRTDLLRELGGFDESLRVCADYDVMWKLYCSAARGVYLAQPTVAFSEGGMHTRHFYGDELFAVRARREEMYRARLASSRAFALACFREWDWHLSLFPSIPARHDLRSYRRYLQDFDRLFMSAGRLPGGVWLRATVLRALLRVGSPSGGATLLRRLLSLVYGAREMLARRRVVTGSMPPTSIQVGSDLR